MPQMGEGCGVFSERQLREQIKLSRPARGFGAIADGQLTVDTAGVLLDSLGGNEQCVADLPVGQSSRYQAQDVPLTMSQ